MLNVSYSYKPYANRNFIKMILITTLVVVAFLIVGHIESHYTTIATVTYANSDGYITAIDEDGEVWAFYGDNFLNGDKVKLTFFTNCTDTIYDDKIVKVVKA